ncbi:DUF4180 domain-containing protein [Phenylobacterium soli]|uniref:DUF4180 domain-containing protein n=1 Tax=Phenylobacterium soli TaxID=2170551 RepID=A0A328AAY2_9CAUL|nr:DUF4180 domain-containing protein [Phenylobacterium soli]RAK51729.1 DUF4180 domain-containing protein [Phenylobacterium soli]
MAGQLVELSGQRLWICAEDGAPLAAERDAVEILGDALGAGAEWVVIPVARLSADFLDLKTRLAGEALQKFVTYGRRVVILGDVSEAVAASNALRDFVRESNRGRHVWFVGDHDELARRLG